MLAESGLAEKYQFAVDVELQQDYPVRGGILCDQIGFGKTATTIALIKAQLSQPEIPRQEWAGVWPDEKEGLFDASKTTLIFVPSHLLEQWAQEIKKFLPKNKLKIISALNSDSKMGLKKSTNYTSRSKGLL